MTHDRMYDVFLSYSMKDRDWVREFVDALHSHGVATWFDVADLAPGSRWQVEIQHALRASTTLVVIISSDSIDSPWTFFEVGAAVADNKTIIPVLIEDVDVRRIPPLFLQFQFIRGASPEEAGKRVAQAISTPQDDHNVATS